MASPILNQAAAAVKRFTHPTYSPPTRPCLPFTCFPCPPQVGGRSVVNKDITQYVEIRPEEDRFLRLLEILGEW